jgi:diadenosine tetraphosphate (Ap4A) HIT family hydrolase
MTLDEAKQNSIAPWDDEVTSLTDLVVYRDRYPCTPGHLLFVPRNNDSNMVVRALEEAYHWGTQMVANKECDGFNVGLNSGTASGQTVMYPHIHLIPRRWGDMDDPTGGVRHVIPERGNYRKWKNADKI